MTRDGVTNEADALEALTEFVIDTQLANLGVLKVFSSGFSEELLSGPESFSSVDYEMLQERWAAIVANEKRTMDALLILDSLSLASTNADGAVRPAGHAAPASGVWANIFDSATGFFGWMSGSGERDRERVASIASNMTPGQQNQLYSEWRGVNLDTSISADNGVDFFRRLQAGEFDNRAGRIHGDLLTISALSIDAPQYLFLSQDENLLMGQVIVDEGSEGLERGAEFAVDASFAALSGRFPDLQRGRELAEEGEEWVEYAEQTYNDPLGAIKDKVVDKIKERTAGRLGEYLDEQLTERVGTDLAERIGEFADLTVGFSKPSDAIDAAADYGIARLEELDASVVASVREGEEGSGPQLVLTVRETGQVIKLPPGRFSIQSFDRSGRNVRQLLADVAPGWEAVVRDALQDQGAGSSPSTGGTVVETVKQWVLAEVRINPKDWPLRDVRDEERFKGTFKEWTVGDGELIQHEVTVERGELIREGLFSYSFDAPPKVLQPNEKVRLTATGEGSVSGSGFLLGQFQYDGDGVGIGGDNFILLDRDISNGETEAFFTAPHAGRGEFIVRAILWNCAACKVEYVYRIRETLPPRNGLTQSDCATLPGGETARAVCQSAVDVSDVAHAVSGSDGANCDDAGSLGDLLACDLLQSVRAGDFGACAGYAEDIRTVCIIAAGLTPNDPVGPDRLTGVELVTYVAMTGDMEAARRIPDAGERDAAIVTYLLQLNHSVLLGETPDRLPPARFCDRALVTADGQTRSTCQDLTDQIRTANAISRQ